MIFTVIFDVGCFVLTDFAPLTAKPPDLESLTVPTFTGRATAVGLARQPSVLNWKLLSAVPLLDTVKLKGLPGEVSALLRGCCRCEAGQTEDGDAA